ncbi:MULTISPECIES: hypothetical protein [Desertifilum]|nr:MULTISPECIES: hypothetical protein [Desertifilum]MDA0211695.1 hypothetical protein [Cyanobacteria bacterium FC1]
MGKLRLGYNGGGVMAIAFSLPSSFGISAIAEIPHSYNNAG